VNYEWGLLIIFTIITFFFKSILDIPKTLEYLETQGVAVIGYKTDKFPEFFVSDSGFKVSEKLNNEKECALLIDMTFNKLKMNTGILITVPVPKDQVYFSLELIIIENRKLMD